MKAQPGISNPKADAPHFPDDVIRAFGEALRTELDAGRSVRIRRLGMWTPYIGDSGMPTVVFHSEVHLRNNSSQTQQKETAMNTTDVDIPFVDGTVKPRKPRPLNHAQLIDVQMLFDEVREEFGLVNMPAAAREVEPTMAATPAPIPAVPQPVETAPAAEPRAPETTVDTPVSEFGAPEMLEDFIVDDPQPLQIDELQESEDVFRMNRDRLFHPPEPRQSNGMRRAAVVMTAIMLAMLGYMVYSSGMLNGILPQNLKYQPTPLERRTPHPVPTQGT